MVCVFRVCQLEITLPLLLSRGRRPSATVVAALSRQVRKLPASLGRSLTWDQGLEMAKHKSFTVATKVNVYFCDPQSPWQRGTNENTNGLLRQYFPKRTDLSGYSQADLDKVASAPINAREKLWALKLRLVNSKPVLHRSIETATVLGNLDPKVLKALLLSRCDWPKKRRVGSGPKCPRMEALV